MKYVILVSHGGLAEGLKSSLSMFAGDKMEEVLALGLRDGESVDDFSIRVQEELAVLDTSDSVLVLGDIVGGSPLTTVSNVLAEKGQLESAVILGGLNLTMGLTGLVMKDSLEGKELAQAILTEASTALQELDLVVSDEDEDEI